MATARLARFITEVAPPQFVSVMRRRTRTMLDTIHEEEKEGGNYIHLPSSLAGSISSLDTTKPNQLLKEVQRFITEVAPPQFVSVMRRRTRTMLDTIHEEEKEGGNYIRPPSSLAGSISSLDTTKPNQLLKEVQRSLSVFHE
ncbi:Unknown protein [Striga hermonthica]|uniref:Uncharacterized protein n=1 Tax=Striga hermonthica TaxID=68872 RepID=A0A9N7RGY9_STRHE|nr:Unknown protein [Striga hermonthica]